jgi:hypothetical protein
VTEPRLTKGSLRTYSTPKLVALYRSITLWATRYQLSESRPTPPHVQRMIERLRTELARRHVTVEE